MFWDRYPDHGSIQIEEGRSRKGGSTEILRYNIFDRLINFKYNALKTEIYNQVLQGKDVVPRTYEKVLKLAGGWKGKSTSDHNNNISAGVAMVQSGGPGHWYQGSWGHRRGRGGRYGKGGGPGGGRGGGGSVAQNQLHQSQQSQQQQASEQAQAQP